VTCAALEIHGAYKTHVRADFNSGARSGANGTPTFLINGHRHDGAFDFEDFVVAIQDTSGTTKRAVNVQRLLS
jgi:protein-disulfide isomerase